MSSTRGAGAIEKRSFWSTHVATADPDQIRQHPLADLWQLRLRGALQIAPRPLRRFRPILAEVTDCVTSLPVSRLWLCAHPYRACYPWKLGCPKEEEECTLRGGEMERPSECKQTASAPGVSVSGCFKKAKPSSAVRVGKRYRASVCFCLADSRYRSRSASRIHH